MHHPPPLLRGPEGYASIPIAHPPTMAIPSQLMLPVCPSWSDGTKPWWVLVRRGEQPTEGVGQVGLGLRQEPWARRGRR